MIIQSLEIGHFGRFRDLSLSLNAGFNVLTGANESGKTTLACFIRAMLFGMESGSEEQKRFLPFEYSGVYGGALIVRTNDRSYRIERSFIPGRESLNIIDLAMGSDVDDPEGLLRSLCGGVDRKTYDETAFLSENSFFEDELRFSSNDKKDRDREIQLSSSGSDSERYRISNMREQLMQANAELEEYSRGLRNCREAIQDAQIRANSLRPGEGYGSEMAEKPEETGEKREDIRELKRSLEETLILLEGRKLSRNVAGTMFLVFASLAAIGAWFTSRANGEWTFLSMGLTAGGALFILLGILFTVVSIANNRKTNAFLSREKRLRGEIEEAEQAAAAGPAAGVKREGGSGLGRIEEMIQEQSREAERLAALIREKNTEVKELEESLKEAGTDSDEDLLEKVPEIRALSEAATEWLLKFGGSGRRAELFGDELRVFGENGREMPAESLSLAMRQAAFLSVRLAGMERRGLAGALPLILDDVFANFDGDRLNTAIAVLREFPGQIVLFSCQQREQAAL